VMNYTPATRPDDYLAEARRYGSVLDATIAAPIARGTFDPNPLRLRVGLVSGDLRSHPVGYFVAALLAHHDPARVEFRVYATNDLADKLTARLRPFAAAWTSLNRMSDDEAARRIRADGVHVLLDLSGHTADNRLPIFGRRPAPVQASWLGYFASTGMAQMDYLLADRFVVPAGEEGHFSERVWRLPDCYLCFTPPDDAPAVGPLPALATGRVTFGCFNNLSKLNERVIALWARVLAAVPGSRLLLKTYQLADAGIRAATAQRFAAAGVAADRLLLEGPSSRAGYLAAYGRVDLALDPFPFPGGTTTVEGYWMGVPTLTRRGDRFISHAGESFAHNTGLADWIADDDSAYVAKAAAFASDLDRLAALRAGLRERARAAPTFDAARYARHFEDALWGMWADARSRRQ
jgi:protein O-GlcNAc transferase